MMKYYISLLEYAKHNSFQLEWSKKNYPVSRYCCYIFVIAPPDVLLIFTQNVHLMCPEAVFNLLILIDWPAQ